MFESEVKTKIMLEGSYRKLKSYYYYNKNFILMRKKIANFESDEEKMDETFSMLSFCLCHPFSNKSKMYIDGLLNRIDFYVLPKKFESDDLKESKIVSNIIPKNKKIKTVNFFINAPIELYILDTLWTVFLARINYEENILSYNVYGNTINESSLFLNDETNFDSRILFNRYFEKYTSWRNNAFANLERNYNLKKDSVLISLDIKSYFYSVVFKFDKLKDYFNNSQILEKIKPLTRIISKIYECYLRVISPYRKDLPEFKIRQYPLPIGLFSSMLLANIYFSEIDNYINELEDITYYGRYVDDILIVAQKSIDDYDKETTDSIIESVLVNTGILIPDKEGYIYKHKPNLRIQSNKIKVLYVDHTESKAIIDIYNDTIKLIPSQADPLPDNNLSLLKFDEVAYNIDNFNKESKIRDIGIIEVDSFNIGRFFSSLVSKYSHININDAEDDLSEQIKQIEAFFIGSQCIEFYSNWLNYMNFLVITQRIKQLKAFYAKAKDEIKSLNYKSLDSKIYKNVRSISKRVKDTLRAHLNICLHISLSLDVLIAKKYLNSHLPKIKKYVSANMFNNNLVAFPLVNYLYYNKDVSYIRMGLSDIGNYPKIETSFKFKWSPRFIHYDELLLLMFYHYNKCNNGITSFDYVKENIVDKFKKINHITYNPFQIDQSRILSFEDYLVKKVHIHNDNTETNVPEYINIAVGSVGISSKKCMQGYHRWKNITLNDKEIFSNILKDCFTGSDKKGKIPMILVLPELCFPIYWIQDLIRFSKKTQIAVVTGLQYICDVKKEIHNYIATILPFEAGNHRYKNTYVHIREKNDYSPIEFKEFAKIDKRCRNRAIAEYQIFEWKNMRIAPLVCFELTDIMARAFLKGRADIITASVFNPDTTYFSNIIDSATRDLHTLIVQANTSYYGDSRVTAPYDRDSKDVFKIKGGENDHIVLGTVDFKKLIDYQNDYKENFDKQLLALSKYGNKTNGTNNIKHEKPDIKPLSARFKKK